MVKTKHSALRYCVAIALCAALAVPSKAAILGSESSAMTQQQNDIVKGIVVDENGETVIGASVLIKGTVSGTVTGMDGRFEIRAAKGSTLVISSIGYVTKEVTVNGNSLSVTLPTDSEALEEVIITGYGTFKKSAYAGSAAVVKTESIKDVPTVSLNEMLQGAAPGVTMQQNSGIPGSATSISIRGMGSFNASNSPLYVIDGIPVNTGNQSSLGTDAGLDALATLNPSDIETLTVIKDAAAASLYGSRAANGVIVITTKKGQSGKASVGLKASWGFSDFAMPFRQTLNGDERRQAVYEAAYNSEIASGKTHDEANETAIEHMEEYAPIPWSGYTDWTDVLFQKGNHQNYDVNISGGTDKAKYFASLGYMEQNGITLNSGLERITGRINADFKATDKITFGVNVLFSNVNQDAYGEGTSYTSPFYSSVSKVSPSDPVYNEDGSWNRDLISLGDRNPLLSMTYDRKREYVTRQFNTAWAQYVILERLIFKTTVGYDYQVNKGQNWYDPRTSNGDDYNGLEEDTIYQRKNLVWTNQLTYNHSWGENHMDYLLGYETNDYSRDYVSAETQNFATSGKHDISNGAITSGAGGTKTGTRLISYIGRINYDYAKRYFLGASFREDGSSRLHRSNRWGSFWSASAAWRLSEESWMSGVSNVLTDAKLRASYGANGTLPSDYFGYMGLSSVTNNYNGLPGMFPIQIANEDLRWEKNYNFNVGVDFSLWNRIDATVEYYSRKTSDLLMDYPISMTTGFDSFLFNIGKVQNRGVELDLHANVINRGSFNWDVNLNMSHNANKILELDGKQTEIVSGTQIHKVGLPYRTFYVYEFAGIDPEDGEPMFYTNKLVNGVLQKETTKELETAERIGYKNAEAKVTGGLINTLRYGIIDLSFNISYQFGGYGFDKWAQKVDHRGYDSDLNFPAYYRDRWQKPGDVVKYEKLDYDAEYLMSDYYANSRNVNSTDFIRLRNLTMGVTVPSAWVRKINIDRCRLYMSGNNLLTWAKYDYYDPESVTNGSTNWGTPPLKTITFGIDLSF
ncbi:MAG: TonB-dependent receptor [Bacteroidales bacterium]|nr:TonB-dependent receptor [Bacteroidales bacterium]